MHFALYFCLQPAPQALQVNIAHGACALAWRDQRVYISWVVWVLNHIIVATPADPAHCVRVRLIRHFVQVLGDLVCRYFLGRVVLARRNIRIIVVVVHLERLVSMVYVLLLQLNVI